MIRPANFGYNEQTAASNPDQNNRPVNEQQALNEFDAFIVKLNNNGVNVFVFDDTPVPNKPDAIFPNNWVSFHPDGTVVLYPMCAPNRRLERRRDIIEKLKEDFRIERVRDLSDNEASGKFLEGTGSIVFDHENKIAYACLSPRTNEELFNETAVNLGYKPISFSAFTKNGGALYHTNVMMCVGQSFAAICVESIRNEDERNLVVESLRSNGKEIVQISFEQMLPAKRGLAGFTANMLAVTTNLHKTLLVLSQNAFKALSNEQRIILGKYGELLPIPIQEIEDIGGGSARCMMAEIFLPEN